MHFNELMQTLQELEHEDWGEPNYPSHLVAEIHRLRRVPLSEFTVENLRIMIGQSFSCHYLVPLALDHLEIDPWVSGNCYEGDLLRATVRLNARFWASHPKLRTRMDRIAVEALRVIHESQSSGNDSGYDGGVILALNEWLSRQT
ncbi:MAG: contact-dependent growth inhibition system immunity protein [Capsulimonadaceae bacterium]